MYSFSIRPVHKANTSFPSVSHLPYSQAEQVPELPSHLNTSTIVLVCIVFLKFEILINKSVKLLFFITKKAIKKHTRFA